MRSAWLCLLLAGCAAAPPVLVRPEPATWASAREQVRALLAGSPGVTGVLITDTVLRYTVARRRWPGPLHAAVRLSDVRQVALRAEVLEGPRVVLVLHDGREHGLPRQEHAAERRDLARAMARLVELRPFPHLAEDDFPPVPPGPPGAPPPPEPPPLPPHLRDRPPVVLEPPPPEPPPPPEERPVSPWTSRVRGE